MKFLKHYAIPISFCFDATSFKALANLFMLSLIEPSNRLILDNVEFRLAMTALEMRFVSLNSKYLCFGFVIVLLFHCNILRHWSLLFRKLCVVCAFPTMLIQPLFTLLPTVSDSNRSRVPRIFVIYTCKVAVCTNSWMSLLLCSRVEYLVKSF